MSASTRRIYLDRGTRESGARGWNDRFSEPLDSVAHRRLGVRTVEGGTGRGTGPRTRCSPPMVIQMRQTDRATSVLPSAHPLRSHRTAWTAAPWRTLKRVPIYLSRRVRVHPPIETGRFLPPVGSMRHVRRVRVQSACAHLAGRRQPCSPIRMVGTADSVYRPTIRVSRTVVERFMGTIRRGRTAGATRPRS